MKLSIASCVCSMLLLLQTVGSQPQLNTTSSGSASVASSSFGSSLPKALSIASTVSNTATVATPTLSSSSASASTTNTATTSTPVTTTGFPLNTKMVLSLQLLSFQGNRTLPDGKICYWPERPQMVGAGEDCTFAFTTSLLKTMGDVQVYMTPLMQLSATDGSLNLTLLSPWQKALVVPYQMKPVGIEVIIHHYGNAAWANNGSLVAFNQLFYVDTMFLDLSSVIPTIAEMSPVSGNHFVLKGENAATNSLTLNYALQCVGPLTGFNCDLTCLPLSHLQSYRLCKSITNTTEYSCLPLTGQFAGQVTNCMECMYGYTENGACGVTTTTPQVTKAPVRNGSVGLNVGGVTALLMISALSLLPQFNRILG